MSGTKWSFDCCEPSINGELSIITLSWPRLYPDYSNWSNIESERYNVGSPVIKWFINTNEYSYLGTINHSEVGVMFTNLAIVNRCPRTCMTSFRASQNWFHHSHKRLGSPLRSHNMSPDSLSFPKHFGETRSDSLSAGPAWSPALSKFRQLTNKNRLVHLIVHHQSAR